jgi:predicted TPR repeat methyltransferase
VRQNRVQWVYSSRNIRELEERYDEWAEDYDRNLEEDFAWRGPQVAAEVFARYVPKEAKVLDAGAGTGLMGEALVKLGYERLTGMDLSRGMLKQAARRNIYEELHRMVMGEPLDFETASFDAVVSVGVLTLGHAPASSLDEMVRVTRSGGYVVFTLRPDVYESHGFREKQAELVEAGKWELVEVSEKEKVLPRGEPDAYHRTWVYRVR